MKSPVPGLLLLLATGVLVVCAENPAPIEKADVLPLAMTDDFEFRKFEIFKNAPPVPGATPIPTRDLMVDFERKHRLWGAIDGAENAAKTGQYFTFFWRSKRPAYLTLRLEYRQAILKNNGQARELTIRMRREATFRNFQLGVLTMRMTARSHHGEPF